MDRGGGRMIDRREGRAREREEEGKERKERKERKDRKERQLLRQSEFSVKRERGRERDDVLLIMPFL